MQYSWLSLALVALVLHQSWLAVTQSDDCIQPAQVCGDVVIEYPFGLIGTGCSTPLYDEYFTVTCNSTSQNNNTKPKAVLSKLNLELTELQRAPDYLIAKIPVARTCADSNSGKTLSLNLSGSPFFIDTLRNVFASVGCDGYSSLYDEENQKIAGCGSTCNPPAQVIEGCNGYHCCQSDLRSITPFQRYTLEVTTGGGCRAGFLTARTFLQTNSSVAAAMGGSETVPVVLGWKVGKDTAGPVNFRGQLTAVAGSVLGALGLGISVVFASSCCIWWCWLWKTKNRRKEVRLRKKYFKRRLKEEWSSDMDVVGKTKLFPLKVLKSATNNFHKDRILGQGGQGTVYKGMSANGEVIAIKKWKAFDDRQWKEFINEVILLSKLYHRNVVKLLGCCLETKAPMLVYEFIANGTLSEHIHNSKQVLLTWEMRKRIASQVAGAISYLHSSLETPIYHRDIKSTNILLGENYHAKVADFGISRVVPMDKTHMTTGVQGTFGYLDPEYFRLSRFTEKSDVYSFGVILVELLTGEHSIRKTTSEGEKSLVVYFVSSMDASTLDEILDPTVLEGNEKKEVMLVADLAKRCLKPRGIERPTMKEVAMELEGLQKRLRSTADAARLAPLEIEDVAAKSAIEMGNAHTSPVMCKDISIQVRNSDDERPLYGASW